jgi:hypothetical protein
MTALPWWAVLVLFAALALAVAALGIMGATQGLT